MNYSLFLGEYLQFHSAYVERPIVHTDKINVHSASDLLQALVDA